MDVPKKEVVVALFIVVFFVLSSYYFFSVGGITAGVIGLGGEIEEGGISLPPVEEISEPQPEEKKGDFAVGEQQTADASTKDDFNILPQENPIRTADTQNINNCTTLRTSGTTYLLTQDASNATHCFHIYAANIELDCQGFSVTYDNGGGSSTFAVNSTGYNNITIRNCVITKNTANGGSNHAINFENSNSTRIINNTITIGLEEVPNSIGIRFVNSDNATIENNTIRTNTDTGDAIQLRSGSDFNLIRGNTINTSTSDGIEITTGTNEQNYIDNNVIGADSAAIRLTNANYTYILNNLLRSANDFEITDNTDSGSLNFLIYNNSFVDLRWHNNGSGWFYENLTLNASTGIGLDVNLFLGNNTFALNFTAFERPARWSRINSSANITFRGLAFGSINELRRVDNFTNVSEDIFNAGYNCTSTGGIRCQIQSYSGGILQFNTTGFSSFTANESASAAAGDTTAPNVTNITPVVGSSFTVGDVIEIGANVTDDTIVSQVFANLSYPNGSTLLFELTNSTDYARRFNLSFTIPSVTGNYNITFVANDTTNNRNASERTNFTVAAAPSPAPVSSSSGGSGSKRSSSSPSKAKLLCSRLFELKITNVESVIDAGQSLDFTSVVKSINNGSGTVSLNYSLETGGKSFVAGSSFMILAKTEERTKAGNLLLPAALTPGSYKFNLQLNYNGCSITSSRTIKVKAPVMPLQLSITVPELPAVAPYFSWRHPLTIFIDREKPVKVTVDQRIKKSGRTVLHKRSTFLVTEIAALTNEVKGLRAGEYQIEFTVKADGQTVTVVKDLVVDSFFSAVTLEAAADMVRPSAVEESGGRASVVEEQLAGELRNIEDLEKLRKITPVKIVVENKQNKVMNLFPDIYQKLDDPYFIITRRTLGYNASLFEKIYGVSYSPYSVAARLLNAEILDPEQIILQPGEKIEKIIYVKEGLANPDPLVIQLYTEEGVQFEQEVDVENKIFSGVAFDVDQNRSKLDVYAFVVPPRTTRLLEEYYAQRSSPLTGAVIFEGQAKQYESYMIEVSMRRKADLWNGNPVYETYNSIVNRKRYFFEFYGPYDLRESQLFVFAQQLNYNPQEYYGDYVMEAIIYRNGEVFLKSNYDLDLGEQKK